MKAKNIKSLLFIILIFLLWQVISYLNIYSPFLLPSPLAVFRELFNNKLLYHITDSLQRVFIGYFIALSFALLLSISSLYVKAIMEFLDWTIQFFRNVPPLGMIPLLILWFGIGETSKIIVIILASFFPMLLNIDKGFKSTDIQLIEVGKAFGFNKMKIFKKIILPYAIPDILVGARIGMGYSYRAIIGAEMIASASGLGYMINFARSMSNTSTVIMGIIVIGLLGLACDFIFKFLIELFLKDKKAYGWD